MTNLDSYSWKILLERLTSFSNDSGTNNIANPYRNKDPPFCFQGKTKPEPTDHVFSTIFFIPSPNSYTLRNSRCLRSLCEKAIRKWIAQPERRNMKLLAWSKRNPPSSTQAIGRGRKEEKGCWEIDALSIQSIDSSEKMPVVEDSELSLACITQGSSAMQVRWFKDDAAINVQTSYRSMWTTLVPKNSKDQYTAILGLKRLMCWIQHRETTQKLEIHSLLRSVSPKHMWK
ncbi:ig-like domain-containing protein [Caerostris extrusa]|uniref:Ig-like domain-containing protein n=1 Tax=Caerostris extrusa TaxID=172846 RepID=A0AAV4WQX1_CAEEX|nr:ig-like domain-containing protein [Caerostris extrusa]